VISEIRATVPDVKLTIMNLDVSSLANVAASGEQLNVESRPNVHRGGKCNLDRHFRDWSALPASRRSLLDGDIIRLVASA
jgi:hypothetical protein